MPSFFGGLTYPSAPPADLGLPHSAHTARITQGHAQVIGQNPPPAAQNRIGPAQSRFTMSHNERYVKLDGYRLGLNGRAPRNVDGTR